MVFIMEFGNVSGAAITAMVVVAVVTILLPVILVIVGKVKLGAKLSSFFIGCGVFFVMALVLEQILHAVVLTITGTKLSDNIWLYALYGGCAAAVFEETGRWFAMKHFLKKNLDFPNAVMYGIGHGGFEAIVVGGITYIGNIVSALSINSGMMEKSLQLMDAPTKQQTYTALQSLWTTPAYQFYLGGAERVLAVVLQIALSLIVFKAVKSGQKKYIAAAYLIHFAVDFTIVLCGHYFPLLVAEVILLAAVAVVLWFALKTTKMYKSA